VISSDGSIWTFLESLSAPVLVDHQRGDEEPGVDEPLCSDDDGHIPLCRGRGK